MVYSRYVIRALMISLSLYRKLLLEPLRDEGFHLVDTVLYIT